MELQIEQLIEKYWNGETSLEEERLIKDHFKTHPSLSKESEYFRFLKKERQVSFEGSSSKKSGKAWLSAAATVTIGILTAILVFQQTKKDPFAEEDPQKALEMTKRALMMIGTELNEGQSYTMEITKINKAKEELSEEDPQDEN